MSLYNEAEAYLNSFLLKHKHFSNIRVYFADYCYSPDGSASYSSYEYSMFHADLGNNTIGVIAYPNWTDMIFDRLFDNNAVKLGFKKNCSSYMLYFFHELGHHIIKRKWNKEETRKMILIENKMQNELSLEEKEKLYFLLPEEAEATKWAIRYINDHIDEVRELENNIKDVIDNYEACKQFAA